MTLIKTSILTSIATIIRMINGFIITKIIAIYVGPSGLAFIGQFQNFIGIVGTFASLGINSGVVKYTAEYNDDMLKKQLLWSSALKISASATILVSFFIWLLNDFLSNYIFKTDEYTSIFIIFSITLILFTLNSLLHAILNGQKEIQKYTLVSIVSSFVSLLLTGVLVYYYGLYGALLSIAIGSSIVFFVTLYFIVNSSWFKVDYFFQKLDKEHLSKLSKFSLMAIVTALTIPVSTILIRNFVGETLSWDEAGYVEGIWKISTVYLSLVTTALGVYYLPRLSEISAKSELKKEIFDGYKIIIPIVVFMAFSIYFFRDHIILILFTEQFIAMRDLFFFQLLGDVIKVTAWLLSYLMVAKAMTKLYVTTEVFFSVFYVVLSIVLIQLFGLVGVTYAFALNYTIYLIYMYHRLKKEFF